MPEANSIKIPTPATVGVDHNRAPKRPIGWPEQAIPVLDKPTPGDTEGIADLPLTFIKPKRSMETV